MKITRFNWDGDTVEHIAKHSVTTDEVEEACFSEKPRFERSTQGQDNRYYILGRTEAGRYLFVVADYVGRGTVKIVTARNMNNTERARYKKG